jgi:hypothetical protein
VSGQLQRSPGGNIASSVDGPRHASQTEASSVWAIGGGVDCPCAPLNRSEVGLTTERMATELDAGLVRGGPEPGNRRVH